MGWGPMNQIGERTKTIRCSLGLSMEEFGKLFQPNVDKSLISRWEKEVNHPNKERIKRIAEIGKVSIDYLNNGVTYRELEKRNIELIEENIQLKAKLDMIYEVIKT